MLRTETVKTELFRGLQQLMLVNEINQFYLVGGTGLALYYGHRMSDDIDLFTHQPFDAEFIWTNLELVFKENIALDRMSNIFLFLHLYGVKVDFVNNATALHYPLKNFNGIRIADERDIATLKLKAIFGRGSKKDFIDLYILLQHFSMDDLIIMFAKKFPNINIGQLLISMQYFEDAEKFNLPFLYIKKSWAEIKTEVKNKVLQYLKKTNQ
jgi:hypothetical protein